MTTTVILTWPQENVTIQHFWLATTHSPCGIDAGGVGKGVKEIEDCSPAVESARTG